MSRIECIDVRAWLGVDRDIPECVGVAQCGSSVLDRCTCGLRRVRVWTMPAAANHPSYPRRPHGRVQ